MSCLTLGIFDQRRSAFPFCFAVSPWSPLQFDQDKPPPTWMEHLSDELVHRTTECQKQCQQLPPGPGALPLLRAYLAQLEQLHAATHDSAEICEAAASGRRSPAADEAIQLTRWLDSERLLVWYNMGWALALEAAGDALSFCLPAPIGRYLDEAPIHPSEGVTTSRRLFEESAGMFDLVSSTLTEQQRTGSVNTGGVDELDGTFAGGLISLMLASALESSFLYAVEVNAESKVASKLASMATTLFGQAHNQLLEVDPILAFLTSPLLNLCMVKHHFYGGLAPFFFNSRSLGRRQTSSSELNLSMQALFRVRGGDRQAAAEEIRQWAVEVEGFHKDTHARWTGEQSAPQSTKRPLPRLPSWFTSLKMYCWWKRYSQRRPAGLEPDPVVPEEGNDEEIKEADGPRVASLRAHPSTQPREDALALSLKVMVPPVDARHCAVRDGMGCTNIDAVVTLAPRKNHARSPMAVAFLVDCTANSAIPQMLSKLLPSMFTEVDCVGIVSFAGPQGVACKLHKMDGAGGTQVARDLAGLRPTGGTVSLGRGIEVALEALQDSIISAASYTLLVCSDGHDTQGLAPVWDNWDRFHALKAGLKREERSIRVHGMSVGPDADRYFLSGVCRASGGEFGTTDSVNHVRQWAVTYAAAGFTQVATKVVVEIKCRPGISLRQIGFPKESTSSDAFTNDQTMLELQAEAETTYVPTHTGEVRPVGGELHDWAVHSNPSRPVRVLADASQTVLRLEDISVGQTTNLLVSFGVFKSGVGRFVTDLASITVNYVDACTFQPAALMRVPRLSPAFFMLDRLSHGWLPHAYVQGVSGQVTVTGAKETLPAFPGNWLEAMDRIVVPAATANSKPHLVVATADGTRTTFSAGTGAMLKNVASSQGTWQLAHGQMWVATAPKTVLHVEVGPYHLQCNRQTRARISWDGAELSVACVIGGIVVTAGGSTVNIPGQKQISARGKAPPSAPWQLSESDLDAWRDDPLVCSMLVTQEQALRVVTAQAFLKAAALLLKGGSGESNVNRRCRGFCIGHWLSVAKGAVTNSLAADSTLASRCRRLLDLITPDATALPIPTSPELPSKLVGLARALFNEQPAAGRPEFLTPAQISLLEAHAVRPASEGPSGQGESAEKTRRDGIAQGLFTQWDLDGNGSVDFPELQQVFLGLPEEVGSAALLRWRSLVQGQLMSMQLTPSKLATLVVHVTEGYDGGEFDLWVEAVQHILTRLVDATGADARARALWNLFQIWDRELKGFIDAFDLVSELHRLQGMPHCQAFHTLASELGVDPMGGSSGKPLADMISAIEFHRLLTNLTAGFSDSEFYNIINGLRNSLDAADGGYSNVKHAQKATGRATARAEVEEAEMKHVFDGITAKDWAQFRQAMPPSFIQAIAKPLATLLGILPLTKKAASSAFGGQAQPAADYWAPLKDWVLQEEAVPHMRNFPIMSLTYKQVAAIVPLLEAPTFLSSAQLSHSRVLAALVDWAKLVMKIVLIENDWRFTRPPSPELPKHPVEKLTQVGDVEVQPGVKVPLLCPRTPDHTTDRMVMLARLGGGRLDISAATSTPLSHAAPHHRHPHNPNTPSHPRPSSARASRPLATWFPDTVQLEPASPPIKRPHSARPAPYTAPKALPPRAAPGTSTLSPKPIPQPAFILEADVSVQSFLKGHQLEDEARILKEEGFDDLKDLAGLIQDDPKVFEAMVTKPGHRRKINRLLKEAGL